MIPSFIGLWVARRGQKAHLVESEITDRLVTRCGRQMRLQTDSGGPLGVAAGDDVRCAVCNGSTAQERVG